MPMLMTTSISAQRWCIWAGPAMLALFALGLMAWNGVIAFYIPVFIFFIWVVRMSVPALGSLRFDSRKGDGTGQAGPPANVSFPHQSARVTDQRVFTSDRVGSREESLWNSV